jgi:hypothetical protein
VVSCLRQGYSVVFWVALSTVMYTVTSSLEVPAATIFRMEAAGGRHFWNTYRCLHDFTASQPERSQTQTSSPLTPSSHSVRLFPSPHQRQSAVELSTDSGTWLRFVFPARSQVYTIKILIPTYSADSSACVQGTRCFLSQEVVQDNQICSSPLSSGECTEVRTLHTPREVIHERISLRDRI